MSKDHKPQVLGKQDAFGLSQYSEEDQFVLERGADCKTLGCAGVMVKNRVGQPILVTARRHAGTGELSIVIELHRKEDAE